MLRLAIDCSTKTAAAALERDGRLAAQTFCNNGLTHSQTLLPSVDGLFAEIGAVYSQVEEVVVTVGPGSFTGVRIGVSTAKGIALGTGAGVVGVSSLAALAFGFDGEAGNAVLCPCFDARCSQVYNALFSLKDGTVSRLCEDRALTIAELAQQLAAPDRPVILCGDGAELVAAACPQAQMAPEPLRYITGKGIFAAGRGVAPCDYKQIAPAYLRLSQAQREREKKLKNEGKASL